MLWDCYGVAMGLLWVCYGVACWLLNAPRYLQGILEEMWWGRTSKCGRLRLAGPPKTHRILLQIPCFLCGITLLAVKPNDLCAA